MPYWTSTGISRLFSRFTLSSLGSYCSFKLGLGLYFTFLLSTSKIPGLGRNLSESEKSLLSTWSARSEPAIWTISSFYLEKVTFFEVSLARGWSSRLFIAPSAILEIAPKVDIITLSYSSFSSPVEINIDSPSYSDVILIRGSLSGLSVGYRYSASSSSSLSFRLRLGMLRCSR